MIRITWKPSADGAHRIVIRLKRESALILRMVIGNLINDIQVHLSIHRTVNKKKRALALQSESVMAFLHPCFIVSFVDIL